MNIQKMNEKMIELREKEQVALMDYEIIRDSTSECDYQRGVSDGFEMCMNLLGYKWMGQLNGGFRRDR